MPDLSPPAVPVPDAAPPAPGPSRHAGAAELAADHQRDRWMLLLFAAGALLVIGGVIASLGAEVRQQWSSTDTWTVAIACVSAMACALPGNFLVLRKLSMMGDAISHAVLPGLVIAFLVTDSRASIPMFIGAAIVGVLTAVFTQAVNQWGKVEESAAMGVVFTSLFALGLLLIRRAADKVHLDADCVLYGEITTAVMDTVGFAGTQVPRALLVTGGVLLVNGLIILLLYKEFKISAFDPALATAMGIHAHWMHYLLMTLVAVTTVSCFESVGSILVIAMLIVPAAVAHLLTDRLPTMIAVSLVVAFLAGLLGHLTAMTVPGWFGFVEQDLRGNEISLVTSTSGMMAVCAGMLLLAAALLAPRHGLLAKKWRQFGLSLRIAREDILGLLYRAEELRDPLSRERLLGLAAGANWLNRLALALLRRRGLVDPAAGGQGLSESGRRQARQIIRSHRLWEAYGQQHLGKPMHDLHYTAESFEHVTDADLQTRLAARVDLPERDPHGHDIPRQD